MSKILYQFGTVVITVCFNKNDKQWAHYLNTKERCILRVTNTDRINNKPRSIVWSVLCSQGELDYIKFMNQM